MVQLDNFQKEKKTISIAKANLYSIIGLIPISILYFIPFYFVWKERLNITYLKELIRTMDLATNGLSLSLVVIFTMIAGIVFHELIHGISWSLYTENGFKSIRFGIMLKMLTPYCHCKEPLKVKHYITGAIMPAIILGLFPALVAIVIGNLPLLIFGTFFTIAAMGDFMIIQLIIKEDSHSLVLDHPNEAGCYIYRQNKI